jgi:hypothetical protein
MTLLDIERLVRKITDLLRQVGNAPVAPKLAEDFAAACHAANLRLQQCEAMIKAKDRLQALQLAETAPNLLDLVTVLEFLGSDEWRDYCQEHALAVAERIDGRAVQALNECYGQGITTDHPLYAVYRRAVLSRNDEAALQSLQSIVRLNPGDNNAASELARLDAKVLGARLERVGQLLQAADAAPLLSEIEAIEAFGFENKPDGDIWRKAQVIRCGQLLEQVGKSQMSNDWMEGLAKLDFIERLKAEFDLQFPPIALRQIETLGAWARAEQQKDNREREFLRLLAELQQRIDASEEKDTSARYVELPELRDDFEGLHKVWRSLVDFARAIPEEAASRFRKRSALLQGEISRRTSLRRSAIFAGAAAVLLIGWVLGWWVMRQRRVLDFTGQLDAAVAQRQFHAAEKLLERLRNQDQALLSAGRVNAAAGRAEASLNQERESLKLFNANFEKLPQHLEGQTNAAQLAQITDRLAITRGRLDALAPDLKAENEPRFEAFERQWQGFRAETAKTIDEQLEKWAAEAEERCQKLDYRALDASTNQMAALSKLLGDIDRCESSFTNYLQLRGDLLERSVASRAKLTEYQQQFKKLGDGMAALRNARTTKEFLNGLRILTSSEFSAAPEALAAAAVVAVNPDEKTALPPLLGISNPRTWAYLTNISNGASLDFVPSSIMPAERKELEQLSQDPAVGPEHWRYRFWLDRQRTRKVEWVTAGVLDTNMGWHRIKSLVPSMAVNSAAFQERDYGLFDGLYRLSPTQVAFETEPLGDVTNSRAFGLVGLEQVWTGGVSASKPSKPLIEVLDVLKDSHEGSPLFRAYLFLQLADLMNSQPDAWGVTFCPSLTADANQLRSIADQLHSGDWFVPAKEKSDGPKFEEFFASIKAVSYLRQATGLRDIARAAAVDGLQYAGFIDLSGKPELVERTPGRQLWAYNSATRPARLVRVDSDPGEADRTVVMPLSPVFALPKPPRQYLAETGVALDDPSFKGFLPQLFEQSTPRQP